MYLDEDSQEICDLIDCPFANHKAFFIYCLIRYSILNRLNKENSKENKKKLIDKTSDFLDEMKKEFIEVIEKILDDQK